MTLIDLIDIIFNNLDEVEDIAVFKEMLDHIKYSSISYLEPVLNEIIKFYTYNNRFPEFSYLKTIGGDLIRISAAEFSSDILVRALNYLKEESKRQKAIEALMAKDEGKALQILQSQVKEEVEPVTGIETVYQEYKKNKERPPGLKTGIPGVDNVHRSWSYKSVNVILAPPKHGKTTTGVSIFYHNLMNYDNNLIYILLEGSVLELKYNLIAAHSKKMGKPISAFKLKSMELTSEEELLLKEVAEDFEAKKKANYALIGTTHFLQITPAFVTKVIKDIKKSWNGKLGGVFSDYIQEYKYYRVPGISDEKAVINFWVRFWHDICISEDFCKVILAQMNREGEINMLKKGVVNAKSMAEANELERAGGRVIACCSTPSMQQSNIMKIFYVYHRYGPQPTEPEETYADFAHFQIGENSFSSVRTLNNVELLLDSTNGNLFT